ncbi:MAG TPA: hypothetical protein VLJ68_02685 [Chitinophagaceae bacterium]|nr:hypothetical protein [Chitinophagaceae bacterium]
MLLCPAVLFGQTGFDAGNKIKEQKEIFLRNLRAISNDPENILSLANYFETEVDNIYSTIRTDSLVPVAETERASRSLVYFISELNKRLDKQTPDLYEIPIALQSYAILLAALQNHYPLTQVMAPLSPRCSQVMATAFYQYKEFPVIDDIAVYKRMVTSPEFILQFLEKNPHFRYADSLLLEAAVHDPEKTFYYLRSNKGGLHDKISKTGNIYLEQMAIFSTDKNASELFPFLVQLAEKSISPEEILERRKEATPYFQMMVNTLQGSLRKGNIPPVLEEPLRGGVKQKATDFYVDPVNDLHGATESIRFAAVKNLRPQDIYYIITSCGDDLYTSSYLGLYKRLMENFKNETADSLFEIVQYDNLRKFIRLAANYNVLSDFLGRLSPERMKDVIHRFISGIDGDENKGLEQAMDIGDSFSTLRFLNDINDAIKIELEANLAACTSAKQYLGIRLYRILLYVLNLVNEENGLKKLWATLGNYEELKHQELENEKGEIIELALFYGDEDGMGIFNSFVRGHSDKSKWDVAKNKNWVSFRSLADPRFVIYANTPLDIKEQLDIAAQDSLMDYLRSQSLAPVILVHRGHSYHLDKSIKRLTPEVRLAILGSCGAYNKAISISSINPDIQVIGSKKMGSSSVNDPIIDAVNEDLISGKDLLWPEIWKNLAKRFANNENTLTLFDEYFPPSNNLGLFVLKLFNDPGTVNFAMTHSTGRRP